MNTQNDLLILNPAAYIAQVIAARALETKMLNQLKKNLLATANSGLGEANKGNPYWTKRNVISSINSARKLLAANN